MPNNSAQFSAMHTFTRFSPRRGTELPQTNQPDPSVVPGPSNSTFMPTQSGAILSRGVSIKGSVKFLNELLIDGEVEGNIFVTECCELQAGCTLHGDIEAPRLMVDENVTFRGNAKVGTGRSLPA